MQYFDLESSVLSLVFLALTVIKIWALVDAIMRPTQAFLAADKLTKAAWLWILGLALVASLVSPLPYGILSLIGTIAAFVYLVDVKPALASVTRRR